MQLGEPELEKFLYIFCKDQNGNSESEKEDLFSYFQADFRDTCHSFSYLFHTLELIYKTKLFFGLNLFIKQCFFLV